MFNFIKKLFVGPSTRRRLDDHVSRYLRLNQKHRLDQQGVSLSVFLPNPEHYQHWITVYFDNHAVFKDRVELAFFIGNEPALILKSLLEHRRSMQVPEALCMSALTGAEFPGLGYFVGPLIGTALWLPLTYVLLLPQYQPVNRDANRPI